MTRGRIRDAVTRCMRCRSPFEGDWDGRACDLCRYAVCSNCLLWLPLTDGPPAWHCRVCDAKRQGTYAPPPAEPPAEFLPLFEPRGD